MGIDIGISFGYGPDPLWMMGPAFVGMGSDEPRPPFARARPPSSPLRRMTTEPAPACRAPVARVMPPAASPCHADTYAPAVLPCGHGILYVEQHVTSTTERSVYPPARPGQASRRKRTMSSSWETIAEGPRPMTPARSPVVRMVSKGVQTEPLPQDVVKEQGESLLSFIMRWFSAA